MAACCTPSRRIVFPSLDPRTHLVRLQDLAAALLEKAGFEPIFVEDEDVARSTVADETARGRYPILLTPLDTSGEKPYEEFVAKDEQLVDLGFRALRAIVNIQPRYDVSLITKEMEKLILDPRTAASKGDLVAQFRTLLPAFDHVETGRDLDQRM